MEMGNKVCVKIIDSSLYAKGVADKLNNAAGVIRTIGVDPCTLESKYLVEFTSKVETWWPYQGAVRSFWFPIEDLSVLE